jgi:alkylhydroperoxidase family enzyme
MGSMEDRFSPFRSATAAALLQGSGATPHDLRQAIASGSAPPELVSLVQKIRSRAYAVTAEDLDALRNRYTEEQLFEIIVAAAFGVATDQISAAHRALEDA